LQEPPGLEAGSYRSNKEMLIRILPAIFACILLAAHFLRAGHKGLVLLCVFTPFLLLIEKRWALTWVRVLISLGALVWLQTTAALVYQRWGVGAPWVRMLLILAGVAFFTAFAAYLLGSDKVRQRYR
jgi:hypothetical protein